MLNQGAVAHRDTGSRVLLVVDLLATLLVALEGGAAAVNGHLDLLGILVLAFVSALGGGIVRDLLLGRVPRILNADVYATAALLGALLTVLLLRGKVNRGWAMALGAVACFALRMTAVVRHWSLPHLSGY